jgi:tRNA threonylcarbamoyladenosine biosynthesis protein TsaE
MQSHIISTNSDTTEEVAKKLGQKLRGGEIIELISDLGGGKTTFIRGLAKGAGSHDRVRSPSFTLANQYRTSKLTLYHFDFYRLDDPGIIVRELAEVLADPKAIVVIEWAKVVAHLLSKPHLVIHLKQTDENERYIIFDYPKDYNYLLNP